MSLRLIIVASLLVGLSACRSSPQSTPDSDPTPSTASSIAPSDDTTPSQTSEEAERDGIASQIAALPTTARVKIAKSPYAPYPEAALDTPEGRWVASHPTRGSSEGPCEFQTPYGRQYICSPEYGELLLLDKQSERILRAYPLPALPPHFLIMDDEAVYCARQGDGGVPHSMVCRVDRKTLELKVRYFIGGEQMGPLSSDAYKPPHWIEDQSEFGVEQFDVDQRGLWVRPQYAQKWLRLSNTTLEILERDRDRPQ